GRNGSYQAGAWLSILALKPQLTGGVILWPLLRRDWRTGVGFCLGVLAQTGLVVATLGPGVLADYAGSLRTSSHLWAMYQSTPDHQHALAGILTDHLGAGYGQWCRGAHLLMAALG